ncbi:MAG: DUF1822 family protein [Cyanomargarita calcarea GSE-NOS-MK-12-04C]|jgi:hypothetical protein|uniref:DUF1822 family protein n=1 Tax=Cyanomargarita calcarea GSE-NOS-MK-12-04C TaxID=2839659 RepID=A0A951URE4_9CYAN|nr:DUF1822 family protein [Cyanomargarita calcarea GSE-NOS-MK-12-04C]
MSYIRDILTFSGPISTTERQRAEQFCSQQATAEKEEQVRLNILSVSFVNSYLQYMGFETDLQASDSWDSVKHILMDVADLSLKKIGFLECRPVFGDTEFVYVPPEVQSNRIGYVVVQIDKSFREATLLGFVKEVASDLFPISQLQSVENLLEYLEELSQVKTQNFSLTANNNLVKLKQWLENIFEPGWQDIESIFGIQSVNPAWNMRSKADAFISRGKLINLGKVLSDRTVVLVVTLPNDNEQEMDIIVEVRPTSEQSYLPPNLQLMVLDFEGASVMEAETRSSNKNIQLQFSGHVKERFSVKLALGDVSVTEDFVIC